MAVTQYEGSQIRYGIAGETTFGTSIGLDQAFTELIIDHIDWDEAHTSFDMPRTHGSRQTIASDRLVMTSGSAPTGSVSGPYNTTSHPNLDYMFFQAVSTAGTKHTFTFADNMPDFTANAGQFMTFVEWMPTTATSRTFTSVVSNTWKLSATAEGLLQAEYGVVGKGIPSRTGSPSGLWSRAPVLDSISWYDIVMTLDVTGSDVTINVNDFEVNCTQDIVGMYPDGSGSFKTFAVMKPAGTVTINMLKDASAEAAFTYMDTHQFATLKIHNGGMNPTEPGGFAGTFNFIIDKVTPAKDDIIGVSIEGTLAATDSGGDMITWVVDSGTALI